MMREQFAHQMGCKAEEITDLNPIIAALPEEQQNILSTLLSDNPYIEGAWMTKYAGRYYLQYACTGTEYNIYGDGVYVSDKPLGPFQVAKNNPYSYNPGGFIPGAGHGSTLEDMKGRFWHTATMRISMNHAMERRIGIWPAGFDQDGELFCNQRYADWPVKIEDDVSDPWCNPEWMLLSYKKRVLASSGKETMLNVVDENVQTWWKAEKTSGNEWICVDLGRKADVRAIQINFADDSGIVQLPEGKEAVGAKETPLRYIEEQIYYTQWLLEGSENGENWFVIEDKRTAKTDLAHDFVVRENGISARYIRLTIVSVPYNAPICISGFRIFGHIDCSKPEKAKEVKAVRVSGMDMHVTWEAHAQGAVVLWGHDEKKLYHSCLVHGKNSIMIGALVADTEEYYVRVDLYNEGGITEGKTIKVTH